MERSMVLFQVFLRVFQAVLESGTMEHTQEHLDKTDQTA